MYSALVIVLSDWMAEPELAYERARRRPGTAMDAMIPTIAATNKSSINVKPCWLVWLTRGFLDIFPPRFEMGELAFGRAHRCLEMPYPFRYTRTSSRTSPPERARLNAATSVLLAARTSLGLSMK